jgi:hypothetical protein
MDLIYYIHQSPYVRSMPNCITLLLNNKFDLGELYPLILKLLSVAVVIPLSTAEVDRVFSQVKLIKTEHRNRLKQETLENILKVKINCSRELCYNILDSVFLVQNREGLTLFRSILYCQISCDVHSVNFIF